ncbi:MAG: phosphopantothenoylcysteine decarboxylase [Chitinophagaceae bacterium]
MGEKKKKGQVLIGFALETENEAENAKEKLMKKNADMIVLNSMNDKGAGFGYDTNKITIFQREGKEIKFDLQSKSAAAKDIVDTLIQTWYV